MKKVFYFSMIAVITMFIMSACSQHGPGDALKEYVKYMINGDYDKLAKSLAFNDEDTEPEMLDARKNAIASMIKEKYAYELEQGGGIESIAIISEEISEDGNTAIVKYKQTNKDGTSSDNVQKMMKKDDKWLMVIDK